MADDEDDAKVNASLDEDGAAEGSLDDDEGKKGSKKLIFLIAIPLLLLGVGGAAYFMGLLDPYLSSAESSEEAGEHGEDAGGHGEEAASGDHGAEASSGGHGEDAGGHGGAGPYFLVIPNQRVNLNSEGGPPTFLQLSVQLELKSGSDKAKVEAVMPRVIDQFQTYLRELRVRDLKGSAGIYRLQAELLNRVNAAAAPIEVQDVLFQEILIQEN